MPGRPPVPAGSWPSAALSGPGSGTGLLDLAGQDDDAGGAAVRPLRRPALRRLRSAQHSSPCGDWTPVTNGGPATAIKQRPVRGRLISTRTATKAPRQWLRAYPATRDARRARSRAGGSQGSISRCVSTSASAHDPDPPLWRVGSAHLGRPQAAPNWVICTVPFCLTLMRGRLAAMRASWTREAHATRIADTPPSGRRTVSGRAAMRGRVFRWRLRWVGSRGRRGPAGQVWRVAPRP